jgi:threonine/homoserine/homoserine lactone efflux protein
MAFVAVSLVALLCGFVGSLPLAGPIAILVVSNAVNGRNAQARRTAYGAAIAEGIYAFLAFWGFATFLARHASVLPISHGATGAIMLALGIHFVRFRPKEEVPQSDSGKPKSGPFFAGFTISILNPTLLATWSAITTFLYSRQLVHMTGLLAIPFGICAGLGIALWAVLLVWLVHRYRDHFPRAALKWIVRGMGIVLMAIAVWSFVELARYFLDPSTRPQHASLVSTLRDGARSVLRAAPRFVTRADSSVGRAADF